MPPTPRSMQEVHILKNVKFLDSPGVPVSPSNPPASVALRSLPGGEGGRREEEIVPQTVRTLLDQYDKTEVGGPKGGTPQIKKEIFICIPSLTDPDDLDQMFHVRVTDKPK